MKTQDKQSLILADDHILLRDALANLISTFPGFKVNGLASDGKEVMACIKKCGVPDIIILDLNMPNMDGYETTRWLAQNYPHVKILILTMYDSDIALIRLLQEGVRGFLKKDINPDELRHALEIVVDQGYYYTNTTSNKIAALFKKSKGESSGLQKNSLTETEIEFLKLASTDMTYKEIAMQLNLSTRVVDNYREGLFEKLNVRSRVGMAIYAIKNGIVSF
ncbi:MAG TPA: response regulator transcription factor [Ferruginibacter sp.]|nr:response regulator transcription factor [Ferruginibacter sp.]HPH91995.1 response regulator transcription factor [Ferruginibacter sp.]